MSYWYRKPYVPVAERQTRAKKQVMKRLKKGQQPEPVEITGKTIALSFWGKGWCKHLESFSDYANRLPRGRTYVRNGSVCHLAVGPGGIDALVSGSSLYTVTISINPLKPAAWQAIKQRCAGQIGSMIELLQGTLSNEVMAVVSDRNEGLFPQPGEMKLSCSCPDWAVMCKHVAAVLYGVGSRLDSQPALLFRLRDVDPEELIAAELALPGGATGDALADDQLNDIFGLDIDRDDVVVTPPPRLAEGNAGTRRRSKTVAPTVGKKAGRRTRNRRDDGKPLPRLRPSGKSVARLRKKLGMTVEQFAAVLGVTKPTVYRWESSDGPLRLQPRPLKALAELHEQAKSG